MKGMNNGEAIALKLKDIEDIDIENYEAYVKELEEFTKNANEKELNELIKKAKAQRQIRTRKRCYWKTSIKRLKNASGLGNN